MKKFNFYNNVTGWVVFLVSAFVYLMTIEPTASFWDCGEFITTSYKFEVGHPPGAPFFMILGRFFTLFGGGPGSAAKMINAMSALASAFTILFLFWTITHLARKITGDREDLSLGQLIAILGSGVVGSLAYTFSDTFWFSAVEGEVYATSSLITAVVFWAILKWEDVADESNSNRWLIFIGYIVGLSIGVHLLNLLAIPAIVFVYYFKKYKVTRNGIIYALIISVLILGFIMYGIIPGFVTIGSWFELLFVNTLGLPFHSGLLFYIILLIGLITYGILYTYKKKQVLWNTLLLGVTVILLGYSSFALIIIRSAAKTPMDQNSPNDTFSLLAYLNREQYGDRPLIYGQYYNTPLDPENRYSDDKPYYIQKNGKYVIADYKVKANYDKRFQTIFPRMWSNMEPQHAEDYQAWGKIKGTRISFTNENGENETIVKPTFGENLRFFFNYQVGFMYFRYFMWNFVGRQDDVQSHGGIVNGNWISGIKFLDEMRLGNQDNLPDRYKNNKGRNKYYFLPLILGLIGIFYQYNKGVQGRRWLWVVFLLFMLTGLAIVIYLNQYPHQPRERDYAYAGSFYAFTIWIGLGVLALFEALKKYLPETIGAGAVSGLTFLLVPVIMGAQNWDDHDRSNRYTCRDLGANYLKTCAPQGIIFTNGDNDTFPLWYNQEVEGVRTDVRVCNLSYLQTDWYISQMKRKAYESEPVPFSLNENQYIQGKRDIIYLLNDPRIKGTIDLPQAVSFVGDDDPRTKLSQYENAAYLPGKILVFKIDKEAVIRNKVVRPEDYDKIVDTMRIDLTGKNYISKDELMIFDLLANNKWERPIYFAITVGNSKYLSLQDYFQVEGFAYRLVPIKHTGEAERLVFGGVASDLMFDNMMNKFRWGNMNDPKVYIDENNLRMMTNIRNSFNRLADALVKEGKNDKAIAAIDRCLEIVPEKIVAYEYFSIEMAETLYKAGANAKAEEIIKKAFITFKDELDYFLSMKRKFIESGSVGEEIQRNLFYLQKMERAAKNNKNEALAKEIGDAAKSFYTKYTGSANS